jgi:hypothetical protein
MKKTNHARFIPNILLLNFVMWITYIDETYPVAELLELYLAKGFGQNIAQLITRAIELHCNSAFACVLTNQMIFDLNVSALVSENGILDQRDR